MSQITLTTASRTLFRPAGLIADALAKLAREWALRQARHAMGQLDDATLHDIGVARGDIDAAVRHGRRALRH